MSPLTFFYPVLKALEDGQIIRKFATVLLQIVAGLVLLGGLLTLIGALKLSFELPTAEGTLGGILFCAILLAAIGAIAQILFFRARGISQLGESPFTVIPILSIILRAAGEIWATLGVAVAIGGCVLIWLANFDPLRMLGTAGGLLPSLPAGESFLGGLALLLYFSVFGAVVLIVFYFLAESVVVLADIARNVRLLVKAQGGPTDAEVRSQPASGPGCPACGTEIEEDSEFCTNCGARLTQGGTT